MAGLGDLVREWAAAWSAGDVARLAALFTEDCVYEDVPLETVRHGHDELAAFAAAFLANVRDARFEIVSSVSEGDRAAAEWVMTGIHRGEVPGLPRADRPVEIRGVSVFTARAGRLASCVDYWDRAGYLRRLGRPS